MNSIYYITLTIYFIFTAILAKPDCDKLCSREFSDKELKDGLQKCGMNDKGQTQALDSCGSECYSNSKFGKAFKEAENQTQCFCEMCKTGKHFMFCSEIKDGQDTGLKSKDECEEKVCSGDAEAKYRWLFCKGKDNPFKG